MKALRKFKTFYFLGVWNEILFLNNIVIILMPLFQVQGT